MISLSPVIVINETDLAWLIEYEEQQYWVPKSECEITYDFQLNIPEWLALEKGMI